MHKLPILVFVYLEIFSLQIDSTTIRQSYMPIKHLQQFESFLLSLEKSLSNF